METPETQVQETQVGAVADVPAANGSVNGSEVTSLKDLMGPIFGTEFKTDADALKSIENAKNMSGKVGQLESELQRIKSQPNMSQETEQKVQNLENLIKQNMFFQEHQEYNTPEAKQLISAMGTDPSQVVQSDAFKMAFTAIQAHSEVEKSKSVVMSNPRLGVAVDKISAAREMQTAGNTAGAAEAAVSAVLEAYEMK